MLGHDRNQAGAGSLTARSRERQDRTRWMYADSGLRVPNPAQRVACAGCLAGSSEAPAHGAPKGPTLKGDSREPQADVQIMAHPALDGDRRCDACGAQSGAHELPSSQLRPSIEQAQAAQQIGGAGPPSARTPPAAGTQPPPDSRARQTPQQLRQAEQQHGAPWSAGQQGQQEARRLVPRGFYKTDYLGRTRRYFEQSEICKHCTANDCWLVAHGKVYDVMAFLSRHPAGEFAIVRHAGTDSTVDFDFHPMKAQKMWDPYLLGYVYNESECIIS